MEMKQLRNLFLFFIFLLIACSQIDTEWHRNKNRTPEVEKGYEEHFKLISDGWKIIGKSETKGRLDWGWEITIIAEWENEKVFLRKKTFWEPDKEQNEILKGDRNIVWEKSITKLVPLKNIDCIIKYILIDKDGFEIIGSNSEITLPNKEAVSLKTTSTISRIDAKRVTGSICKIRIE